MSLLKHYKPTTPARRHSSVINFSEIVTTDKPYKKLIIRKKNMAGRNNTGKITIRHRGGGYRNMVRQIDFKRNFPEGFRVISIEYDPGRTSFICLVTDLFSGTKKYILHSKGLKVGEKYGLDKEITEGNQIALSNVPVGSFVSQIEINPNGGAKMVRSAGNYAIVTAQDEKYTTLKLPSGEIRKFLGVCRCVIGRIGKEVHNQVRYGKAGRIRHMGFRPTVRGKVMNPVDHPHGGGEARNSIGMKYPKTPWGKHAIGVKTRDPKKASSRVIVSRRAKKK